MKTKSSGRSLLNNIGLYIIGTALALMVPVVGNWPWGQGDFIIMGTLIFGICLIYESLTRILGKQHKLAIAVVLLIVFLLIWAELAVGVFGTPIAGD